MVRMSNTELDNTRVSCFMCHRGKVQPEQPPDTWKAQAEEMLKKGEQDKRPAEAAFKNIQALKGMPAGKLMFVMQTFSKSLGVKCDHCHVPGAFDKDDKLAKQTARKMIHLVDTISKEIFKGENIVNCYTCHKGEVEPVSFPAPPQKTQ
jgi:cytochrome c peroxidase